MPNPNPNPKPNPIPIVRKFHVGRLSWNRLPVLRSDEGEKVYGKRFLILSIRIAAAAYLWHFKQISYSIKQLY